MAAIRRIEHVGIMVRDMDQSIRFYEEVIGLANKGTLQHGKTLLGFLGLNRDGETEIELIQRGGEMPAEGRVHHVAFAVEDIEAEHARIRALNRPGFDEMPNGRRYFFFDGPDGERLEFFQTDRQ